MADNPVPDLFCPEILADLDDIENYYVEHLKDQPIPLCDSLLDQISVDHVPQQEASLCETWDESWWKNSQYDNDDILTADEETQSLTSQDNSTASAYSPYNGSLGDDPSNETASQLLNEILNNCQGHYDESQQSCSSVVPTLNSTEYAFLNTETTYLLSVVPSLIMTAELLPCIAPPNANQDFVSNQQSNHVNESSEISSGTPEEITVNDHDSANEVPDHDDRLELSGAQLQAVEDVTEDDMILSQSLLHSSGQIVNRATNSQVVPNLQMMLLAHRDVDNAERDENNILQFHGSGSQADYEDDSQVVPFWDQEE